ncbi:acyl carrier protein [Carboxylicivirga sp. A043]|uniref:phosphopantetheine-binding protein n=1 Tax=Carboxylicivirga litoralis TaxID=2816963 RepID=UPI0021CB178A|nr:phosphopantetheine-binding protein [Carboxylicivirga sp. A043]MCU4155831.1 acyl carrier protein [Carboxylicivirga sp. A043]
MDKEQIKKELIQHIIEYLNLSDYTTEDITDDMPLFGDSGLELDSIDSLELTVMLEREFGVKITNPTEGRKILVDVNSMADFIIANKEKADK